MQIWRQRKVDDFEEEIDVRQDVACEHSEEEDIARLTAKNCENETDRDDEAQKAVAEGSGQRHTSQNGRLVL